MSDKNENTGPVKGKRGSRGRPDPSPRIQAAGRTLAEFRPLGGAEERLLQAVRNGEPAIAGQKRPSSAEDEQTIRAGFLRFLLLGGDEEAPVHERGVMLWGAFIEGRLDLRGCNVKQPLAFFLCRFSHEIIAIGASFHDLSFIGTRLQGLKGDGMKVTGPLLVRDGCRCFGELRLAGASVGGTLEISNSRFYARGKVCFGADRLSTGGSLMVMDTRCLGTFRLTNASIGGAANFKRAIVINRGGAAIIGDGLKVVNDASFSDGFRAVGEVRLLRAVFRGDLDCERATLRNPNGVALNARSARIESGFLWRAVEEVVGSVSLNSATTVDLADDIGSWLKANDIILDGFTYDRIAGVSSTDADSRIRWLLHQQPLLYGASFWPQPWHWAAHTLREMGHLEQARLIAMEQQRVMRKLGLIGSRKPEARRTRAGRLIEKARINAINWSTRRLHLLYGALAGYGYRPLRTVGWMAVLWLSAAGIDAVAYRQGLFVAKTPSVPTAEAAAPAFKRASFSPTIFSLDAILPLVDLKQESDWTPAVERSDGSTNWFGWAVRAVMWFQILFGWLASLLLVAAVGRLVQKD